MDELFRVRGFYKPTKRDAWVTKSWASNRKSAEDDIMMFVRADNWSNVRVVSKTMDGFFSEINSGKRKNLPKKHSYY